MVSPIRRDQGSTPQSLATMSPVGSRMRRVAHGAAEALWPAAAWTSQRNVPPSTATVRTTRFGNRNSRDPWMTPLSSVFLAPQPTRRTRRGSNDFTLDREFAGLPGSHGAVTQEQDGPHSCRRDRWLGGIHPASHQESSVHSLASHRWGRLWSIAGRPSCPVGSVARGWPSVCSVGGWRPRTRW